MPTTRRTVACFSGPTVKHVHGNMTGESKGFLTYTCIKKPVRQEVRDRPWSLLQIWKRTAEPWARAARRQEAQTAYGERHFPKEQSPYGPRKVETGGDCCKGTDTRTKGINYRWVLYCPREGEDTTRQTDSGQLQKASGRQDLLIFLHTAIQYSSDSKLFLLPPQPPYIKRMHFLLLGSKYQRGITARQGPVMASWEQTAVWRWVRTWAGEEHRPCQMIYMMQRWLYFIPSSEAPASALLLHQPKGFCQFWGGLTLQCIHHKLVKEMPAHGASERATQLTLSLHGALIHERFLQEPEAGTTGICSADATALCPSCPSGRPSTL